jgi:hypothetical protein
MACCLGAAFLLSAGMNNFPQQLFVVFVVLTEN